MDFISTDNLLHDFTVLKNSKLLIYKYDNANNIEDNVREWIVKFDSEWDFLNEDENVNYLEWYHLPIIENAPEYDSWETYLNIFSVSIKNLIVDNYQGYRLAYTRSFLTIHIAYGENFKYLVIYINYCGYEDNENKMYFDNFINDNCAKYIIDLLYEKIKNKVVIPVKEIQHEHFDVAFTLEQNRGIQVCGDGEVMTYKYKKTDFELDFNVFIATILFHENDFTGYLEYQELFDYHEIIQCLCIVGKVENLFQSKLKIDKAVTLRHDGNFSIIFIDDKDYFYFVRSMTT